MSQRKPTKPDPQGEPEGLPPDLPSPIPGPATPSSGAANVRRQSDAYEGSGKSDPRAAVQTETAPEVSRGAWRERAFVPRGTMPADQVLLELERALQVATMQKRIEKAIPALKTAWAPLLRQAVEQGGGDGLDAALRHLLKVPGPSGLDPLLAGLCAGMRKLNLVRQLPELEAQAKEIIGKVAQAIEPDKATRISFKVLERQLEGRIDLDALLEILFSEDDELAERLDQVERTLQSLRDQLKAMPGVQPDGMFSNYARLKVEKRVIEAEQAARGPRG